jgi:hypothetical protein
VTYDGETATTSTRGSRRMARTARGELAARMGEVAAESQIGERHASPAGGSLSGAASAVTARLRPRPRLRRARLGPVSGLSIASRSAGVGVREAVPPRSEIRELAFELAAPAAKVQENPSRRETGGAAAGDTDAGRSAARSAAAMTRSP